MLAPPRYLRAPRRVRTAFPALRHRNFRLFIGGQFLSLCGTWMQTVAHGWLVLTLTNSPLWVGLVPAIGALPILLFTLYGGVLADRVHKQRFVIILQSLMSLEAFALAYLTYTHRITVSWVVVLAVFFGFLAAFEVPTRQAFVADMVGKEDLMNAIAINSSAFNLSRVIGPTLAGLLIATAGLATCFLANGLSYVAVVGGLLMMRIRPEAPRAAAGLQTGLGEGWGFLRQEAWSRSLIIMTAVLSVFGFSYITMLPVYARDALHVGAGGYGAVISSVGIGALIGALGIAALGRRVRQARAAIGGAVLLGGLLVGAAVLPSFGSALPIFALIGSVSAVQGITTNTFLQQQAPDALRGRVMGFYSFVALGLAPLGSLQAGWVAEQFGVRTAIGAGGIIAALCSAGIGWFLWRTAGPTGGP